MRKDKMTKIMTKLFGREAPLDTRLFNVILVGTMVASALGVSATLAKGASVWVAAVVALMVLLFAFFIWFGNTFNKIKECGLVVGIVYNVILLPIIYFFAGGTESGMNSWFSMGIISCFLLYTGRRFYLMLGLSSVSFLSCYFVNYFHPEFVVQLKSKSAVNFDCCFAMMAVSTVLGILIKFQKKIYEQERQVSEMQKIKIEEANRTKSRFLASMSHEIRTPINTIIGLNEMNLREAVSPEVEENSINIQRASRMLLSLINDVLDLSKIESGKMEIIPRKYEFSVLLSDMINITWIRAQEKKLEFKMDIDPEVPGVLYGDDVRISQVVTNLLTNAIKYTQQGSVTLGVRVLSIVDDYVKLRISVSDTGMGIKTEDIPFLFNSFQRLDESQNRAIEGTGLGLAISKQLVDMMDGEMAVESIYQKGSTFSITLKQKIIDRRPMEYALKILNSGGKHSYKQTFEAPEARVLIVDDNEMNRIVAKKLLRATKVRVDLAASGAECLEMVRKYFYHVIFMDHMMPGMDGIETLKSIRKQENGMNKGVPVIALTANVVSGAEKMYRSKGFQGYLMKPI
ncbi:MAG: response regulator, partial [Lachnospiraceae bacterium]|nr:response regulator [Lachnospiraceae bacterium]